MKEGSRHKTHNYRGDDGDDWGHFQSKERQSCNQ